MNDPDRTDEEFRRIIEGYGERARLDPEDDPPADDPERLRRLFRDPLRPASPPPAEPARAEPEWDDEDTFVPPEAPPVPHGTRLQRAAWFGLLGVPALLLVVLMLGMRPPMFVLGCLAAWFLGGAGYLFTKMRRNDDDGWDSGAVV
ncbi:hypothetical protein J2S59_003357 [Nocardioides massiliensis]|uniref:DUF1707 domain-containing protein n=2 Tax=Nocardioides massiliensis TaxID=1325935 RepID=A0ABT9NT29_9ACTN|nr:hypothetical protein [Nocardioides massiliensis]MDP9823548.1 hypothetical protein [Nocardioides massiliensis]